VLTAMAAKLNEKEWGGELYAPRKESSTPAEITAIPYCVWENRAPGEMLVWIREA
jgi:DUF1680 family protein